MLHRFSTTCLVACMMAVLVSACSGGSDPTSNSPGLPEGQGIQITGENQHLLWGLYDVSFDPATQEITSIPLRTAEFNANVTRFLQPPSAPIDLLIIVFNMAESNISQGLLALDITVRHPWPGNKAFRGFDVRGIIMTDGGMVGQVDPGVNFRLPGTTEVTNADGYTRWWNQAEFTTYNKIFGYTEGKYAKPGYFCNSTVNPYKLHAYDLDIMQPFYQLDPAQRATFPAVDGAVPRRYRIQFDINSPTPFRFKYAIDASWAKPDPAFKPLFPLQAFGPKANLAEPYMVRIDSYEEIPYYVDEYVSGGNIIFNLVLGDWQATGGNVLAQISHVWLESPNMFEPIDVIGQMVFVESTTPTQATYKVTVEDVHPDGLKDQQMLITVESAVPNTWEPQIGGDTSWINYPDGNLASYLLTDVPITNLAPQGNYAYVYFIPDWCATMRDQCTQAQAGGSSGNQQLLRNIMGQNIDGYYNDYLHVQVWEGKVSGTSSQNSDALQATCASMGYSFQRTYNGYFDPAGCRVVMVIGLSIPAGAPNPPFTHEEALAMQEFIQNGGILFFMCEASQYFYVQGFDELFQWLGMLMEYGGGATPEMSDGYTWNIVHPHFLTINVNEYHYYTVGQWITEDPYVLPIIRTEYDEKVVLIYPLPLE